MADSMESYLSTEAVSAGVIDKMVNECPLAGWFESFMNPNREPADTEPKDRGSVAHEILLLGSEDCVAEINPNDHPAEKTGNIPEGWTNKSIRAARDEARAAGKIPLLAADLFDIRQMVSVARTFLESLKDAEPYVWRMFNLDGGVSESTITWEDGATLCKMRPDRINVEKTIILNYKTTQGTVEPERWARTQMLDYYLGGAFYCRGARAKFGTDPEHLYLVQQVSAPYLCSLVGLDPHFLDLGARKVITGLAMWEDCVKRGRWPGYPARVVWPEVPAFEEIRWTEREAMIPLLGSQP